MTGANVSFFSRVRRPCAPRTRRLLPQRRAGVTRGGRYGCGRVDIEDYTTELIGKLAPDARALACEAEMRHVLSVIREGSSADRQVDHFRLCLLNGDTREEAMRSVVDMMLAETRKGVF